MNTLDSYPAMGVPAIRLQSPKYLTDGGGHTFSLAVLTTVLRHTPFTISFRLITFLIKLPIHFLVIRTPGLHGHRM